MTSLQEELYQLVTNTKDYLLDKFRPGESVDCSPEALINYQKIEAAPVQKIETTPVQKTPIRQTPQKKFTPPPSKPIAQPPPKQMPIAPSKKISTNQTDFSQIRQLLEKVSPTTTIKENVPCDAIAKQTKQVKSIPIVTFQNHPNALAFLQKVAQAISSLGASSTIITVPSHAQLQQLLLSNEIKLIIIDREPLTTDTLLSTHYRYENDQYFLKKHPVFPLPPINQLLQSPHEKARLWQEIQARLK